MDFKLFKHHINRTLLLAFIIFIAAMIIGVAIVTSAFDRVPRWESVGKFIIIIVDGLLMSLILWLMHLSGWFVSNAYQITKKKYITKAKTTEVTKFNNPIWLHIATVLFFAVIFILSITILSDKHFYNGWVNAAKNTWWIMLIIFFVNLDIYEMTYNVNIYKFNHDQEIISSL